MFKEDIKNNLKYHSGRANKCIVDWLSKEGVKEEHLNKDKKFIQFYRGNLNHWYNQGFHDVEPYFKPKGDVSFNRVGEVIDKEKGIASLLVQDGYREEIPETYQLSHIKDWKTGIKPKIGWGIAAVGLVAVPITMGKIFEKLQTVMQSSHNETLQTIMQSSQNDLAKNFDYGSSLMNALQNPQVMGVAAGAVAAMATVLGVVVAKKLYENYKKQSND